MKQQARLALEFFLPPLLASLPLAVGTAVAASKGGEYNSAIVFFAFVGVGFALAAIPAFISAVLAEVAVVKGIDPTSKKVVGMWALFGLLAGVAVSKTLLTGDSPVTRAATYAIAWGVTGLLVSTLERQRRKNLPNKAPLRMPVGSVGRNNPNANPQTPV
jgi:hypothetical protein